MVYYHCNRCKHCANCGTLFIYESEMEGLSDDENPFEPCPECGCDDVSTPKIEPLGGFVAVVSREIVK